MLGNEVLVEGRGKKGKLSGGAWPLEFKIPEPDVCVDTALIPAFGSGELGRSEFKVTLV